MHRYRVGQIFRPPSVAESAANADSVESHRRSPAKPQDLAPVGQDIMVKSPTAGIEARDDMTIYSALCTRCIEIDGEDNTKTLVETDEERRIYNLELAAVPGDSFVNTALTLHGTRHAMPTVGLVKFCTKDNHPGMGVVFEAYAPGVWNSATHDYDFTCDADHTVKIIDRDYGVPEPNAGAQGYARWEASDDHGQILVVVTMDCDSRGICCT